MYIMYDICERGVIRIRREDGVREDDSCKCTIVWEYTDVSKERDGWKEKYFRSIYSGKLFMDVVYLSDIRAAVTLPWAYSLGGERSMGGSGFAVIVQSSDSIP